MSSSQSSQSCPIGILLFSNAQRRPHSIDHVFIYLDPEHSHISTTCKLCTGLRKPHRATKWASWVAIGVVILLVVLFLGSILIARLVGAIGGLLSPVRSSRIRPAERMWYGPENVA